MSNEVLISIRPEWCDLIKSGEKTIEVRKTSPKQETPFKVYIYETKARSKNTSMYEDFNGSGMVIGEFICDRMVDVDCDSVAPFDNETKEYIEDETCLTREELWKYTNGKRAIGWHISDLKIYGEPVSLDSFLFRCKYGNSGECVGYPKIGCLYQKADYNHDGKVNVVMCGRKISKAPQSWCHVERT